MILRGYIAIYFLFLTYFVDGQTSKRSSSSGSPTMNVFSTTPTVDPFQGLCSTLGAVDSCKNWDMDVILVLDNRSISETFKAVQSFLGNLTTNCPVSSDNSGSSFTMLTPASLNQNINTSQCFSADSCHQLIFTNMTRNSTFVSATNHDNIIITLFVLSLEKFLPPNKQPKNRGKVIYFITNLVGCTKGQCELWNLTEQQWPLANYMSKNGIVFRMLYLEQFESRSYNGYSRRNLNPTIARPPFTNFGIGLQFSVFNQLNEIFVYPNLIMFREAFNAQQACPNYPVENNDIWEYFIKYGIPAVTGLLVVLCCGCLCLTKSKYKMKLLNLRRRQVEVEAIAHANQASSIHHSTALNSYVNIDKNSKQYNHIQKDKWEIAPQDLFIDTFETLGSGAFATVYKGILKRKAPVFDVYENRAFPSDFITNNEVAVKVLPSHADDESKKDFLNEISFMKKLGYHTHIVSLLGCVTNPAEPSLVVEYCAKGDLLKFLRKHKPNVLKSVDDECPADVDYCIRVKDLLSFAWQISDGMEYLSSRDYIHRDVAARNILVTKKMVAKIGDFGLCRFADQALYTTKGGLLPIKWMAIESLKQHEYTTKSDVWSFGVLLFELFTLGDGPYPAVQPLEMASYLEAGNRLSRPELGPENLYDLMKSCWQVEPALRPTFTDIRSKLTFMLDSATEHYGYLDVQVELEIEDKTEMQ